MKKDIIDAITRLTARARDAGSCEEALKFSQSALNLAHTDATLSNTEITEKLNKGKTEAL